MLIGITTWDTDRDGSERERDEQDGTGSSGAPRSLQIVNVREKTKEVTEVEQREGVREGTDAVLAYGTRQYSGSPSSAALRC